MTPHWSWGPIQAVILMVTIYANGRQWRTGWLLGVAAQLVTIGYGYGLHGQPHFLWLLLPAGVFAANWVLHPRRVRRRAQKTAVPGGFIRPRRELTEEEVAAIKAEWCELHKGQ